MPIIIPMSQVEELQKRLRSGRFSAYRLAMVLRWKQILLVAGVLQALLSGSFAQSIAFESFSQVPLGALSGSGADASGWSDAGWTNTDGVHIQCAQPSPTMAYQIPSGALIEGGDRAVLLTANPQPIGAPARITRSIPPVNTTIHVSFLVRVVSVGSGTDVVRVLLGDSTDAYGRVSFTPNLEGTGVNATLSTPTGYSWGSGPLLTPGRTYFVVVRIARFSATEYRTQYWVDGVLSSSFDLSIPVTSPTTVSRVQLDVASSDSGGPALAVLLDELRVGYTFTDVSPLGPPPQQADLVISRAVKLKWLTQSNAVYQVQSSPNLTNWSNLGSPLPGDGQPIEFFDSADGARRFYRVIRR